MSKIVYRNEYGEITGWDYDYPEEPDYDPYRDDLDESPYEGNRMACIAAGVHGRDADGVGDGTYVCLWCYEDCTAIVNERSLEDDSPWA